MTEPVIARRAPFVVEVEQGKTYYWCRCGLSKKQPFCDGSHASTDLRPIEYTAQETQKAFFCGCKHSKNKPLCDGTHKSL